MSPITKTVIKIMLQGIFNLLISLFWLTGMILAIVVSWESNHSIPWSFAHGLGGWMYVFWHFDMSFWFAITTSTALTSMWIKYRIIREKYIKTKFIGMLLGDQGQDRALEAERDLKGKNENNGEDKKDL